MENKEQLNQKIGQIMARCWIDEDFKQRLLRDTAAVLREQGLEVPEGVTVNIVENTDQVIHYVLPPKPRTELSDADLDTVAGGKTRPPGCPFDLSRRRCRGMGPDL